MQVRYYIYNSFLIFTKNLRINFMTLVIHDSILKVGGICATYIPKYILV